MDPMAASFMFYEIEVAENNENKRRLRLQYRNIRDNANPFEMPNNNFIKNFLLTKIMVRNLIIELKQFAIYVHRRGKIPFHLQVLLALNFYGHGSYQTGVGRDLNIAISQPVVSRIIANKSNIFAIHMLPRYVKFPASAEETERVKRGFAEILNFPGTIGAIDCTHVAIIAPPENQRPIAYMNRKGYHSVNVQGICDANMVFLNINARYPGSTHDAAIWQASTIKNHLMRRHNNGERQTWLIGDSGYPLQPWLMTPILHAPPNTPEERFTIRHCSARNVVERCFGVLKQRFRCLLKHRTLHYSHTAAGKIIYACVVLHNICRRNNMPIEFKEVDEEPQEPINFDGHQGNVNDVLEAGRLTRRNLVHQL